MTETEFRGLKLMMLEKFRRDEEMRDQIRGWEYGNIDGLLGNREFITCHELALPEFRINPNNMDLQGIRERCFCKAFDDATGQRAYGLRGAGNRVRMKKRWCEEFLRQDGFLVLPYERINNQGDFDNWYYGYGETEGVAKRICEELTEYARGEIGQDVLFNFGNAQKLINMLLKYFYMLSLYFSRSDNPQIREFFAKIERIAGFFHVPIDSIVLGVLLRRGCGGVIGFRRSPTFVVECGDAECTWSQIPNNEFGINAYKALQDLCVDAASQANKCRIAWECDAWLNAR